MPKVNRISNKNHLQSVLFDKNVWVLSSAKKWLENQTYYTDGLHDTKNYLRFRQYDTNKNKFDYRILTIDQGIKFVYAYKK